MNKNTLPNARRDLRAEINKFELTVIEVIYDEVTTLIVASHMQNCFKSQKHYAKVYKSLVNILRKKG